MGEEGDKRTTVGEALRKAALKKFEVYRATQ